MDNDVEVIHCVRYFHGASFLIPVEDYKMDKFHVDPDRFSYSHLLKHLRDLGYLNMPAPYFFYKLPGEELSGDGMLFTNESITRLTALLKAMGTMDIYVNHNGGEKNIRVEEETEELIDKDDNPVGDDEFDATYEDWFSHLQDENDEAKDDPLEEATVNETVEKAIAHDAKLQEAKVNEARVEEVHEATVQEATLNEARVEEPVVEEPSFKEATLIKQQLMQVRKGQSCMMSR